MLDKGLFNIDMQTGYPHIYQQRFEQMYEKQATPSELSASPQQVAHEQLQQQLQ